MRKISLKENVICLGWQSWDSGSDVPSPVEVLTITVVLENSLHLQCSLH